MVSEQYFMAFGALIAIGGFALARNAQGGDGKTIVKVFGQEITLAAAGGILVIFLGAVVFALPTILPPRHDPRGASPDAGKLDNASSPVTASPSADGALSNASSISGTDSGGTEAASENVMDAAEPTPVSEPSPTPLPTTIAIIGPRTNGDPQVRSNDGWLSDAPDYRMIMNQYAVNYGSVKDQNKCVDATINTYAEKGVLVDWAKNGSLMFATGSYLIRIWCKPEEVRIVVAGPPGDEISRIGGRVQNTVIAALNTLQP